MPLVDIPQTPPEKVPALPGASRFSADTRRWYRTWAHSRQAAMFTDTDWLVLHMLAPLVDDYYLEPTSGKASEIRLQHAKLGATPEDRLRLRWKLDENKTDEEDAAKKRRPARERTDPRLTLVEGTG